MSKNSWIWIESKSSQYSLKILKKIRKFKKKVKHFWSYRKKSGNSKGAKWYVLDLFWIPGIFPISSENLVLILTLFKFTNFLSSNILASFSMCTKNDLRPKLCKRDKKNPNPLRSCKRNILQDCHQDYPVPLPVAHIWTSDQAGKKSFSVSFWKASLP